jgi:hypothetical protein
MGKLLVAGSSDHPVGARMGDAKDATNHRLGQAERTAAPSAVDLKFLSDVRRARHRNFKSKSRTRIISLLVHLWIPKFAPEDVAK